MPHPDNPVFGFRPDQRSVTYLTLHVSAKQVELPTQRAFLYADRIARPYPLYTLHLMYGLIKAGNEGISDPLFTLFLESCINQPKAEKRVAEISLDSNRLWPNIRIQSSASDVIEQAEKLRQKWNDTTLDPVHLIGGIITGYKDSDALLSKVLNKRGKLFMRNYTRESRKDEEKSRIDIFSNLLEELKGE